MRIALLLVAAAVSAATPAAEPRETLLADLPPEVRGEIDDDALASADLPAGEVLERVLRAAPAYRFESGRFTVYTDRRWYRTIPEEGIGSADLVLRRWPGDTLAAFYVLAGASPSSQPSVRLPAAELRALDGDDDREQRWSGRLRTELGSRPLTWIERAAAGEKAHLGILLLPGDAGFGERAVDSLLLESLAVARRLEVVADAWKDVQGIAEGVELAIPEAGWVPGEADERQDPWQIVNGAGFTLGLPPGLRARRTDLGVPPPREIAGDRLWLRGRFVDRDGERVVVGDGRRTGYLAVVDSPTDAWKAGSAPPRGAPDAESQAGEPYDVAAEWSAADWARAERWREPGFAGDWLVFRLGLGTLGVEIGLPVLAGRRSLALFWIPAMWRGPGEPPAPPPIDPAKRFGIRFETLVGRERRTRPLTEGLLWTPGFRMEVPKGWWPVANLRSTNGFPVTLVDTAGAAIGQLDFLERGTLELEGQPWAEVPRPRSYGAEHVRRRPDGAWVFVSADGWAYLLAPAAGTDLDDGGWERMARSVGLRRIRERRSVE